MEGVVCPLSARPKAPLPQRAAAAIGAVDVLNVSLPKSFHEPTAAIGALGRQQQMHVVGHEAMGVDGAPSCARVCMQVMQVVPVIIRCKKASTPVVAPLDQMGGNASKRDARAAGHVGGWWTRSSDGGRSLPPTAIRSQSA